jgi:hypothetical protein
MNPFIVMNKTVRQKEQEIKGNIAFNEVQVTALNNTLRC